MANALLANAALPIRPAITPIAIAFLLDMPSPPFMVYFPLLGVSKESLEQAIHARLLNLSFHGPMARTPGNRQPA
jgi:hypothetical protein